MSPYEIVEHTADAGVRITAPDLASFFTDAATGMFHIICEGQADGWDTEHRIELSAPDLEDLLVDWLCELLYLFEIKKFVFQAVTFDSVGETGIAATVRGVNFRGEMAGAEIKAVTYHMIDIRRESGGFEATVYFDL
jgi:SHS2 domain-containing protein